MSKSPYYKNNWEEVKRLRDLLTQKDVENYPVLNEFELAWDYLSNVQYTLPEDGVLISVVDRDADEKISSTPLGAFLYNVDTGFYPPPELMLWIANSFELYFRMGGQANLEHIFFGREKPSVGNYASRKRRNSLYEHFSMCVTTEEMKAKHQNRKAKSLTEVFEDLSNFYEESFDISLEIDSENFLRSWRRWKKSNMDK
ncbi:MAG: hypothetical protein ACJA2G_002463 [Cognaticolwellia sp.]|jgi:hypothetical protein